MVKTAICKICGKTGYETTTGDINPVIFFKHSLKPWPVHNFVPITESIKTEHNHSFKRVYIVPDDDRFVWKCEICGATK